MSDKFTVCFHDKTIITGNVFISDFSNNSSHISVDVDFTFNWKMQGMLQQVKEIISKSPNKSCDLDPLLT